MLEECGSVFIVSFDTISSWTEGGIMQTPDDIYENPKFQHNEKQRLMLKFNKKQKLIDLLTAIRKKVKYPLNEISLYRLRFDRNCNVYKFWLIDQD